MAKTREGNAMRGSRLCVSSGRQMTDTIHKCKVTRPGRKKEERERERSESQPEARSREVEAGARLD